MAKQLRFLFFGLMIVALAIFACFNIWQSFSAGQFHTGVTNDSVEMKNVDNSHELLVKQTQQRTWELIMSRLKKINNTNKYRSQPYDHGTSSLSKVTSLVTSAPLQKSPVSLPFVHPLAPDAVRRWNPASTRRLTLSDVAVINVTGADCSALFRGDKDEARKAKQFQDTHSKEITPPMKFIQWTSNCTQYVAERHYATWPVNTEEAEFSIAFSILMFKHVEQFERLLRAIYRPQNLYCVHVDNKSSPEIHVAVNAIARCFENVFVLQRSFAVSWGTFSVLQPELACMRRLLRRSKKWKYFINLTGQELPLKTNWQIVQILKAFNGSNNMEGTIKRLVVCSIVSFLNHF